MVTKKKTPPKYFFNSITSSLALEQNKRNYLYVLFRCMTILVNNRCPPKIKQLVYENCGFLNYLHPRNPFRGCIDKNPRLAEALLHACAKDACHYWMLGQLFMKKLVCGYMSSFAETCARNGFKIVWRHESFCREYSNQISFRIVLLIFHLLNFMEEYFI